MICVQFLIKLFVKSVYCTFISTLNTKYDNFRRNSTAHSFPINTAINKFHMWNVKFIKYKNVIENKEIS